VPDRLNELIADPDLGMRKIAIAELEEDVHI
jgi:hypothetical protein